MKKQHSFKRIFAMGLALFAMLATASAQWTTYDASQAPLEFGFALGTSSAVDSFIIIDDGGNSLIDVSTSDVDKNYWKYGLSDASAGVTLVARVKAVNDSSKVTSLMIYDGVTYGKIYLYADGGIKMDGGSTLPTGLDFTEFHVFRLTYKDTIATVWADDVEIMSAKSTKTSSNSASIRFGDASSSDAYAAIIDWMIWDETGAYAPGEGADYPVTLDISPLSSEDAPNNWTTYDASITPLEFGFELGTSTAVDSFTIIADEDNADNSLIDVSTSAADKNYWKHKLSDASVGVTLVSRLKAVNDSTKATSLMIYDGVTYGKAYINPDGKIKIDGGSTVSTGLDFTEYHVFRISYVESTVTVWVDDEEILSEVSTKTSTNSASIRFGDASSSDAYAAIIDWMIWDETGAYTPAENSNYPSSLIISPLTGAPIVVEDFVKFDEATVAVDAAGEVLSNNGLECNVSYTLSSTAAWFSISPLAGDSGVNTFTITAKANTDPAPRSAVIKAMIGFDVVDELTVTQEGQAEMLVIDTVYASSEQIEPNADPVKLNYAANVMDADATTGWAPTTAVKNGEYEWIKLVLEESAEVALIKIVEKKYSERNTVISVEYWDGTQYTEVVEKQITPTQTVTGAEMAFVFPSTVTTDTILVKCYGKVALDETDADAAASWFTYTTMSVWGGESTTALDPTEAISFSVYPNPSAGNFTITEAAGSDIKVISLTGQVVFQKLNISANEQVSLNVQNGIYLLQVGDAVSKIAIK